MSIEISFGIATVVEPQATPSVEWEADAYTIDLVTGGQLVPEADGVRLGTQWNGYPRRSMPTTEYLDFVHRFADTPGFDLIFSDDLRYPSFTRLTPEVRATLAALHADDELDADRVRFLQYWSRRAVEKFGERAVIGIS